MNQLEIGAKTDSELLEIWRDQLDYRADVVQWVSVEIERRGLSAESIQLMTTADQARRENAYYETAGALRGLIKLLAAGLPLSMGGLHILWEASKGRGDGVGQILGIVMTVGGILFLWLAKRKIKRS